MKKPIELEQEKEVTNHLINNYGIINNKQCMDDAMCSIGVFYAPGIFISRNWPYQAKEYYQHIIQELFYYHNGNYCLLLNWI